MVLEVLARTISQKKEIKAPQIRISKEKIVNLFKSNDCIHTEFPKDYNKKKLELISIQQR